MMLAALFIAIMLMFFLIVGIACLVLGWRTQKRSLRMIGSILFLGVIGIFIVDVIMDSRMEWNPYVRDDSAVVGVWQRDRNIGPDFSESVTLRADKSCEYHSDAKSFTGKWERHDWNLRITATGVDSLMRFIAYDGKLMLMTQPPDDPDLWNGDLGLKRMSHP